MYNIILTTMSTLPNFPSENYYFYEENGEVYICSGVGQLEAGTKYFLSRNNIDKIVVIGTTATEEKKKFTYETIAETHFNKIENEEILEYERVTKTNVDLSAEEFYKKRIKEFVNSNHNAVDIEAVAKKYAKQCTGKTVHWMEMLRLEEDKEQHSPEIVVVKDRAEKYGQTIDNVEGITREIFYNGEEKIEDEINLYIDMQGGVRTSGYVRNAVLSILSNEKDSNIQIKEIVATEYNPAKKGEMSKIVVETKRYQITDLAAAMNSFVRYGKADLLLDYCQKRGVKLTDNTIITKFLNSIEAVDDSISLCNIVALETAISDLRDNYKKIKGEEELSETDVSFVTDTEDKAFIKSIIHVLCDGIKRDYGDLLELEKDSDRYTITLIDWCTRKGFIQQALTLVEDKMPGVFLKSNNDGSYNNREDYIITYQVQGNTLEECNDMACTFGEVIGQSYYPVQNNFFSGIPLNGSIISSGKHEILNRIFPQEKLQSVQMVWLIGNVLKMTHDPSGNQNWDWNILWKLIQNNLNEDAICAKLQLPGSAVCKWNNWTAWASTVSVSANSMSWPPVSGNNYDWLSWLRYLVENPTEIVNLKNLLSKNITSASNAELAIINLFSSSQKKCWKQWADNFVMNKDMVFIYSSLNDLECCTEEEIVDLKVSLENACKDNSTNILDLYCKYRALEEDLYDEFKKGWYDPERLYHVLYQKDNEVGEDYKFLTMMHFVDKSEKNHGVVFNYKKNNKLNTIEMEFTLNEKYKQMKEKLDRIFRLYTALKQERNCANHASAKGVRLPAKVVKRALEIYVKEVKEILDKAKIQCTQI